MTLLQNVWSLLWHRNVAYVLLAAICLKAWLSYDGSWDSWWYHIPFAARLWDIVPASQYQMEPLIEQYYQGLPLLSEWLQGMLWWLTGRVQATNLLAAGSFVLFILGVGRLFALPLTVYLIAVLAIPVVQAHITSSYIDLPGNLALAAAFLMIWSWWAQNTVIVSKHLIVFALLLAFAANSKFQFLPGVLVAGFLFVTLCVYKVRTQAWKPRGELLRLMILLFVFVAVAISYVPVRNIVQHGNPLYPLIIAETTPKQSLPNLVNKKHLAKNLTFTHWLTSIFEIDRPYGFWSIDQLYFYPDEARSKGHNYSFKGGYNWLYVVSQLILLGWLLRGSNKFERRLTLIMFGVMSVLVAWLPRTQELRYYMFWMIWLVSINVILLVRWIPSQKHDALMKGYYALMCAIVVYFTQGRQLWSYNDTLDDVVQTIKQQTHGFTYLTNEMYPQWIAFAKAHEETCIVRQQPFTFFYTSYFNGGAPYKIHSEYLYRNCAKGTLPPRIVEK